MNLGYEVGGYQRQTTSEEVFRKLQHSIISLQLTPGTKVSEVEIAKQYSVSRQPVREAFMRLSDLDLLKVRPQKATLVRKISLAEVANTRFIRAAVEVAVIRQACKVASDEDFVPLEENLRDQEACVAAQDLSGLRALDYDFHRLICLAGKEEHAFRVITENKAHTDRICTLELADQAGMTETLAGHKKVLKALQERNSDESVQMMRLHLAHLDDTLTKAHKNHPHFFEDE